MTGLTTIPLDHTRRTRPGTPQRAQPARRVRLPTGAARFAIPDPHGHVGERRPFTSLIDAKAASELLGVPHTWILTQARERRIPHHRLPAPPAGSAPAAEHARSYGLRRIGAVSFIGGGPDGPCRQARGGSAVPRRSAANRWSRRRVLACLGIQRLGRHVEAVVRPDDRPGFNSDLREPGRVLERLEHAPPLALGEAHVADRPVLEAQAQLVLADHLDLGHVHEGWNLAHMLDVRGAGRCGPAVRARGLSSSWPGARPGATAPSL